MTSVMSHAHAGSSTATDKQLLDAFTLGGGDRGDGGFGVEEAFSNEELIAESYRGIRPAPGYPACPDHTEKAVIWRLLDAERRAGVSLTESYAMSPAASVSGWYFSHPSSHYFGLGKIDREQAADYAGRKGKAIEEVERWLAPNLCYDPRAG